jgi:hypothetical protein
MYLPESLEQYDVEFFDTDPRAPNYNLSEISSAEIL